MADGVNKFVSWTLDIVKEIKEIPAVAASASRQKPLRPRSSLPRAPDGMVWDVDEEKKQWRLIPGSDVTKEAESDGEAASKECKKDENEEEELRGKTKGQQQQDIVDVHRLGKNEDEDKAMKDKHLGVDDSVNCRHEKSVEEDTQHLCSNEEKRPWPDQKNINENEAIGVVGTKEDMSYSAGDPDQFDTFNNPSLTRKSTSCFDDEASEEKTQTDEEIASILGINSNACSNSVGGISISATTDDQWEIISEKSGSAVLVSFSGSISGASFRSASPSLAGCANKFILTELSTEESYIEHVVLPTDTLQGLCVAYKISATRLRMENGGFSGNNLQMAPKKLKIPITNKCKSSLSKPTTKVTMVRTQDRTRKEFKLYAFLAEMTNMELVEAKAYLDLSTWDLEEALRMAREEEFGSSFDGDASGGSEGVSSSPLIEAVAKPKTLTANDIFMAPPLFEGDGFEMQDIKRNLPSE